MKILYCMNSSWGWIKQRPHFIAEGLSKSFDVKVLAVKDYKKKATNDSSEINLCYLHRFPLSRFDFIKKCNTIFHKIEFRWLSRGYDTIWVASPLQFEFIKPYINGKTIIYDCMDDQVELASDVTLRNKITELEFELYKRADIVISSSNHLAQVLKKKYGEREIAVVNNAISSTLGSGHIKDTSISNFFDHEKINVTYIGTIAPWIDFDLLGKLVQSNPKISINMFGPLPSEYPQIEGVKFHGIVQHSQVADVMSESDILIMPFIVNNLIESVNPVKLYEYIYSGKACFAPKYGESEKFSQFVYLYNDREDCISLINTLISNGLKAKQDIENARKYVFDNTWEARIKEIMKILEK